MGCPVDAHPGWGSIGRREWGFPERGEAGLSRTEEFCAVVGTDCVFGVEGSCAVAGTVGVEGSRAVTEEERCCRGELDGGDLCWMGIGAVARRGGWGRGGGGMVGVFDQSVVALPAPV
ncbi:hypothetical protein GCM10022226_10810 [Sphaerisporangium flaviroseum]|uniref:Uncharacterized protein n=1 Tax=Sphaerisporangium flaviroseum TaxID=509199 RepID=A0ABP7HNL6_9ACTN